MKRIGILTSGGDCQGLNAAIRGVCKALYEHFDNVEIYGIFDGYRGLIEGEYRLMQPSEFSGILTLGGTILGTSRQPFKLMQIIGENEVDKVSKMKKNYAKMKLDCLVVLGGNGTHKTAHLLSNQGLNVVSLPKTIDNDLWGTDVTFGFQSSVDVATDVIDAIHTTATSHGRIFIIELMGHKAGWLTLHAGIAGGADIIVLPEIPYRLESIVSTLNERTKKGKQFSILAVAEGALSKEESMMSKKEFRQKRLAAPHLAVSYQLAADLQNKMGQEIRMVIPGHYQRGGSPCAFDRVLASRLGAGAAGFIGKNIYGVMAAMVSGEVVPVPLGEVAGKLKQVPVDSSLIQTARNLGVGFGD